MTLDEARALIAQTESPAQREAAEQLLNEAIALPQLPHEQRDAALLRIRQLQVVVPDYQLSSLGASVLETVGDSLTDPALQKVLYAAALYHAEWYASGATSGGEGTARSLHVREIEAKLQALDPASRPAAPTAEVPPSSLTPSPLPHPERRSRFLTAVGWSFIGVGALGMPVSACSSLMILAGGDGSSGGSFFDGLIVLGGPPATLVAGIGLLRRRRWAYGYVVGLLSLLVTYHVMQILRGSTPEVSTVSASGVITTVLASSPNYPLHILMIAICAGLLVKLSRPAVLVELYRPPGT